MTALAAETLDLGDSHALHTDLGQCVSDIVEPERLDDSSDQLHVFPPRDSLLFPERIQHPSVT